MTEHLRAQLRHDPIVREFGPRVRRCGQPRSFFETVDGSPCPIFIDSIWRGYPQRGGTIDAPAELIAEVLIQLAFDPEPASPNHVGWLERIRARLRRYR